MLLNIIQDIHVIIVKLFDRSRRFFGSPSFDAVVDAVAEYENTGPYRHKDIFAYVR